MEIRKPQQQRSILKKNQILEASYQLFSEVGYYNTNTAEIAKRANVSTGIVYGYFKDKRDILLNILEIYINDVYLPILKIFDLFESIINLENIVNKIMDEAISVHKKNKNIHEALHSMTHTDKKIKAKFIELEDIITQKMFAKLEKTNLNIENSKEKIHLAMNIIQSFSHEFVYDKHSYIDYEKMKTIVCNSIISLFK